jgi:hypothetical protein
MSWENDEYAPEYVIPSRRKKQNDMLSLALTSRGWAQKENESGGVSITNLPPELQTRIFEYLDKKPIPLEPRGRRPPGTQYRQPGDFLARRKFLLEIPKEAKKRETRRQATQAKKWREEARLLEEERIAQLRARIEERAALEREIKRLENSLRGSRRKTAKQSRRSNKILSK